MGNMSNFIRDSPVYLAQILLTRYIPGTVVFNDDAVSDPLLIEACHGPLSDISYQALVKHSNCNYSAGT